jgi:putative hydrolase of the HAD superfamily
VSRAGLADDVPLLVGVDTLGFGKPDPRVFAEACRRLGTEPARTAYVGDELDVDARAAVAAGLRGVWLARPHLGAKHANATEALPQDVVIASLDELPGVLGL